MRSRITVTLALPVLTTGAPIAAANPTSTTPSDASTITAQAPVAPAASPGIVEVSGTSATSFALGTEVWGGGARSPLSGTAVRNYVLRGRREASDPRLTGHFESRSNCDYEFPDTGYVGSCWASLALGNDDGTWEGARARRPSPGTPPRWR